MIRKVCSMSLALLVWSWGQTGELITLEENGPRDARINMVIVGDGYTSSDKAKFEADVRVFADALVEAKPFKFYRQYLNIYGIFVESNEAGADKYADNIYVDTYFDAIYGPNGSVDRLLTVNTSRVRQVIDGHVPEAQIEAVVVNDTKYGGSGGSISVANSTSPQIVAHEVGHTYAGLGDEYEYAGSSPRETPNTTKHTAREDIVWSHWIEEETPIPTPKNNSYNSTVGLYEGAAYNATGWYRPYIDCRMRTNGLALCPVCAEAFTLTMYENVRMLLEASPAVNTVVNVEESEVDIELDVLQPDEYDLQIQWYVNDVLQNIEGKVVTLAVSPGNNSIKAVIQDTTSLVLKDENHYLVEEVEWQVVADFDQESSSSEIIISSSEELSSSSEELSSSSEEFSSSSVEEFSSSVDDVSSSENESSSSDEEMSSSEPESSSSEEISSSSELVITSIQLKWSWSLVDKVLRMKSLTEPQTLRVFTPDGKLRLEYFLSGGMTEQMVNLSGLNRGAYYFTLDGGRVEEKNSFYLE